MVIREVIRVVIRVVIREVFTQVRESLEGLTFDTEPAMHEEVAREHMGQRA
jgi:hypothetical protein